MKLCFSLPFQAISFKNLGDARAERALQIVVQCEYRAWGQVFF
jgi:hypothetical protein